MERRFARLRRIANIFGSFVPGAFLTDYHTLFGLCDRPDSSGFECFQVRNYFSNILIPIEPHEALPGQWKDWGNWLLGIWLCISPWALRYYLDSTATRTAVISRVLIILAELVTLSFFRSWEESINVILGAWLTTCPWILGISGSAARASFIAVGVPVLALAIYEIWDVRRKRAQ